MAKRTFHAVNANIGPLLAGGFLRPTDQTFRITENRSAAFDRSDFRKCPVCKSDCQQPGPRARIIIASIDGQVCNLPRLKAAVLQTSICDNATLRKAAHRSSLCSVMVMVSLYSPTPADVFVRPSE